MTLSTLSFAQSLVPHENVLMKKILIEARADVWKAIERNNAAGGDLEVKMMDLSDLVKNEEKSKAQLLEVAENELVEIEKNTKEIEKEREGLEAKLSSGEVSELDFEKLRNKTEEVTAHAWLTLAYIYNVEGLADTSFAESLKALRAGMKIQRLLALKSNLDIDNYFSKNARIVDSQEDKSIAVPSDSTQVEIKQNEK